MPVVASAAPRTDPDTLTPTPSASQSSLTSDMTRRPDHISQNSCNPIHITLSDSQSTSATEISTPTSPIGPVAKPRHLLKSDTRPTPTPTQPVAAANARQITPERHVHTQDAFQPHATQQIPRTPVSVTSPSHGSLKRFANGHVKSVDKSPTMKESRSRTYSSGSTGSMTEDLKTRLAYAMAKVQHGWEHHNLTEVERLAAELVSPKAPLSPLRRSRVVSHSAAYPKTVAASGVRKPTSSRRPSAMHAPRSPIATLSPRRTDKSAEPYLDIESAHRIYPTTHSGRSTNSPPGHELPTTPEARRSSSRTAIAQDEQDAMDALLLMGSPGHGPASAARVDGRASVDSALEAGYLAEKGPTLGRTHQLAPRQALNYAGVEEPSKHGRGRYGPDPIKTES